MKKNNSMQQKTLKRTMSVFLSLTLCASLAIPAFGGQSQVMKCGLAEHTHTSDCYTAVSKLTCTLEETESEVRLVKDAVSAHTHTAECYDEENTLICTLEESEGQEAEYEVIPGHAHTAECYDESAELTCTLEEHTHTAECYGDDREIVTNPDDSTQTVKTPIDFETTIGEGEDQTTAFVTVTEDGKAIVTVGDKEFEGDVEITVEEDGSSSAMGEKIETTSVAESIENEDGTVTIKTTYTTTYTTETTLGRWVTYTVTYTEPIIYTPVDTPNSQITVTVDDKGTPTVTGIKEGMTVTLIGSDDKQYEVTQDGEKFYVTIGGEKHEVVPTVTKADKDGEWLVTWAFADATTVPTYTVEVDKKLPEGMTIDENGKVALDGEVTIGENVFKSEDGKYFIKVGEEWIPATLEAIKAGDNLYTLSWSYKTTTPGGTVPVLPKEVTVVPGNENDSFTLQDSKGTIIKEVKEINGAPIIDVTIKADEGKVWVTCKDKAGNLYVYAVDVTASQEGEGYDVTYQEVSRVEKSISASDEQKKGIAQAKEALGANGTREFIAIVLPDGSYLKVAQGALNNVHALVSGEAKNIKVTVMDNKLTISYKDNSRGTRSYSVGFPELEGCTIKNIVYSYESVNSQEAPIDHLILYIDGIVFVDEYGEVKTLKLTVEDGQLKPTEIEVKGDADVGGKEQQTIRVSQLNGSAVVVVKTEGGNIVEMTYKEYLEEKGRGNDNMTLVGVLESTIDPQPTDPTEPTDPNDPVIPVIPDNSDGYYDYYVPDIDVPEVEVPLAAEPERDLVESEVPLTEEPEVEVDEVEVPLAEEPEVALDEPEVPLAGVPQTGDNSHTWIVFTMISGAGLIYLALLGKKRKDMVK